MHARPEGWSGTRARLYRKSAVPSGLPDIHAAEYFLGWMADDLGWCDADGMGNMRPHSWAEIDAFARQCGLDLEQWEARQIRQMSEAYVSGMHRGAKPMIVAPVYASASEDPGIALEREQVSEAIRKGMGGE